MAQRRPPCAPDHPAGRADAGPNTAARRLQRKGPGGRYIDPYFGTEYPSGSWPEGPLEVITRTYQTVFREIGGPRAPKTVRTLMEKDPELLDFALGALFRYDPL